MRNSFLFALVMVAGCKSLPARIDRAYVEADRKTFRYVAPKLMRYVEADGALDDEAKNIARRVISSWKRRIDEEVKSWK